MTQRSRWFAAAHAYLVLACAASAYMGVIVGGALIAHAGRGECRASETAPKAEAPPPKAEARRVIDVSTAEELQALFRNRVEHAEVRLEGKDYIVQDGDVITVRFAT